MKLHDPTWWYAYYSHSDVAIFNEAGRRIQECQQRPQRESVLVPREAPKALSSPRTKTILSDTHPTSVRSETLRPRRGRPQAFSAGHYEHLLERIRELRRNRPCITLQEIADHVGVSQRTLRRTLRRISAQTGEEIGQ